MKIKKYMKDLQITIIIDSQIKTKKTSDTERQKFNFYHFHSIFVHIYTEWPHLIQTISKRKRKKLT